MLRSIFISLLILSTLSSEGLANIPLNIYIYCDCDGNFSIIDGENLPSNECIVQNDMEEAQESIDALNNEPLLLRASSEIKGFGIQNVDLYSLNYQYIDTPKRVSFDALISGKARDLLLGKSDVSPPIPVL